jgi:hypothetical protein
LKNTWPAGWLPSLPALSLPALSLEA